MNPHVIGVGERGPLRVLYAGRDLHRVSDGTGQQVRRRRERRRPGDGLYATVPAIDYAADLRVNVDRVMVEPSIGSLNWTTITTRRDARCPIGGRHIDLAGDNEGA